MSHLAFSLFLKKKKENVQQNPNKANQKQRGYH